MLTRPKSEGGVSQQPSMPLRGIDLRIRNNMVGPLHAVQANDQQGDSETETEHRANDL